LGPCLAQVGAKALTPAVSRTLMLRSADPEGGLIAYSRSGLALDADPFIRWWVGQPRAPTSRSDERVAALGAHFGAHSLDSALAFMMRS